MKRHRVLWQVTILALLAGSGCGLPPSRPEFAARMSASTQKLKLLGMEFRKRTADILKPGPDVDEGVNAPVRSQYQEIEETVRKTKAEYAKASLPAKPSSSAPGYLEAYKKYLDTEQAIVDGPLRDVVAILEDKNTPRANKWSMIEAKFVEARTMEKTSFAEVKKAEDEYAKEHKYKMVQKRSDN